MPTDPTTTPDRDNTPVTHENLATTLITRAANQRICTATAS